MSEAELLKWFCSFRECVESSWFPSLDLAHHIIYVMQDVLTSVLLSPVELIWCWIEVVPIPELQQGCVLAGSCVLEIIEIIPEVL